MRNVLQKSGKVIGVLLLVGVVCFGYLYVNHDIGVQKSRLEEDIRAQQKVPEDWTITGDASDTVAAYVSYPEDQSDHNLLCHLHQYHAQVKYLDIQNPKPTCFFQTKFASKILISPEQWHSQIL